MSFLERLFSRKDATRPDWSIVDRYVAWLSGGASSAGIQVNPSTAMQSGAVYSCVKVLAESVASLPWQLLKLGKNGSDYELATRHPLFFLLSNAPNDFQTSYEFLEQMVTHVCLRGNAYAFINRGPSTGAIAELLPQHPDTVTATMTSDWRMNYRLSLAGGGYKDFSSYEIFHLRGQSLNGWLGLSPIAYARESIGLALAAERFGSQLFRNGAKVGGVLEHPGKMTEQAYQRLKNSFDEAHSGDNAHKTALLEEGVKYSKISMTPDDAQFLTTRQYQRSEIAAIFRVPPHMIGDLSRSTFTNIEQQSLEFITNTLAPWLTKIEQKSEQSLLTENERDKYGVRFDTSALLRGDATARSAYYTGGIVNGWLTRNEARKAESRFGIQLPQLPDLDKPLMPLNMREAGTPPPALPAPSAGVDQKPPTDPAKPADPAGRPKGNISLVH